MFLKGGGSSSSRKTAVFFVWSENSGKAELELFFGRQLKVRKNWNLIFVSGVKVPEKLPLDFCGGGVLRSFRSKCAPFLSAEMGLT